MNAVKGAPTWPPPRNGGELATHASLDALANGRCSPDEFLREILERFHDDRNGKWEVLSFLDQYYRRGKIKLEVFQAVKSRLAESALGARENTGTTAPPSAAAATPPTIAVTPSAAAAVQPPRIAATPPAAVVTPPTLAATPSATAAVQPPRIAAAPPAVAVTVPAGASGQALPAKAAADARTREIEVGDLLRGRYRIQEVLGHGGMGSVFGADDEYRLDLPDAGRRVAVKVPHTAVSLREDLLKELQLEFQHLQSLSHPNIVRVHEFDRDGDIVFFTMEALKGVLLGRVLDSRRTAALPRPYALSIIRDVGAALSHAHSRGVVHGDLNPRNIFLTDDGGLRILDFGASRKMLEDPGTVDGETGLRPPMATQGYASCQLLEGQHPDARDDLFAFACLTYVLLSGTHPFPNRTAVEACAQRWRPARPPELTGRQWRVLREGLRWDREQRPRDVQGWLDRFGFKGAAPRLPVLSALFETPAPRKSKVMLAAAVAASLALLAAVGYWVLADDNWTLDGAADWSARAWSAVGQAAGLAPRAQSPPSIPGSIPSPAGPSTSASRSPQAAAAEPRRPPTPTARALAAPMPGIGPPATTTTVGTPAAPASAPATRAPAATAPVAAGPAIPSAAAGRIEMAADTVDVLAADKTARVVVRRRGSTRGGTDFTWWTESGTAKPGTDFTPATPRTERFEDGKGSVTLDIPLSEQRRSQPKSFYVVIDRTEAGAALGARTLTMVTLLPSD